MSKFETSVDTQILEKRILEEKGNAGKVITYGELSKLIGRDICKGARGLLYTALRRLMRDHQIVTAPEPKVGIRILSDVEIAASYRWTIDRVRRESRRGAIRVSQADFSKLSGQALTDALTGQSMLGALVAVSTARAAKRVESRVAETQKVLPLAETLKHFGA